MDIYLTAAADALARRAMTAQRLPSKSDEDTYYAQHSWSPTLPTWLDQLIALAHSARVNSAEHEPAAHHA